MIRIHKETAMSARKTLVTLISLAFLLLLFPLSVHAETYILCLGCDGTGKCELCDPAKGSDRLGDGWMGCWLCHGTGYAACGTNHTGDGTPIGCDGSGYMPDGTVCVVCNGTGRYACDVCNGTGIFECQCRQLGIPGRCRLCYGTGWRLINSSGVCYNTTPVYPSNGSTIDTSNFGDMGTMTYDASRYGTGITAAQFEAIKDGNSGNNSGGNNNPPAPNPPGSGPSNDPDHPEENPPHPEDDPSVFHPDTQSSFYAEPGSDSDIKKEIASDQDEICFICRYVAGNYLFTVKAVRSQMSDSELDVINNMTETDINDFRGHLEAAANGIDFTGSTDAVEDIRLEFGNTLLETFPFNCEITIEVPLNPDHTRLELYYIDNGKFYCIPSIPVKETDANGEHDYLIFTLDRFGMFVYTDQTIEKENTPPPEIPQIINDQPNTPAGGTANTTAETAVLPVDSGTDESTKSSSTPAIIIILIAVIAACGGAAFYLRKKKS